MSTKEEAHANAYMLGTDGDVEITRLVNQDQAFTTTMELLPRGLHVPEGARVLDVACGPAGWTRGFAEQHPTAQVLGVDISQNMLAYANAAARAQRLPNISFQQLDITKPWEMADASFDLVNARLMIGFLNNEKWQHVIAEMLRVLVPGGTIILAETDSGGHTNSPAIETLSSYVYLSARRAGLSQHPIAHHMGITPMLGRYLAQAGATEIRQEAHVVDFSAGAPSHRAVAEDFRIGYKLMQPYILRQNLATQEELDTLYQQLLDALDAPDFRALIYLLRIWGKKPL